MIEIAVCDDDTLFMSTVLSSYILSALKVSNINYNITYFENGNALINNFKSGIYYNIVILDIDMPEINGKEIAEKLRTLNSNFYLIFITSFRQEIYNTIPYRINAFISKDSDRSFFISELSRVFNEYIEQKPKFEIFDIIEKNGDKSILKLCIDDIYYFSCFNKAVYLNTCKNEYMLTEKKLEMLIKKYSRHDFFEIFRGIFVNLKRVKKINNTDVEFDNEVVLPLSRRKRKGLLDALSKMLEMEVYR